MANPLFNSLFGNSSQVNTIQQLAQAYKSGSNPVNLLQSMASNNPNLQPIINALKNGANPQQLFYDMCKEREVDPNMILSQLK